MKLSFSGISTFLLLASSVESRWVPKPGLTWSYSIASKDDVILERKEEVITIDFEKKKELIEKLHKKGKKVICYFSGGTIEKHRDDIADYYAVPGLIKDKEAYTEWDELWLDYRMEEIKPLIRNRMKIAVDKKCDAIEVDCLGAYNYKIVTERWDDPLTKEDAYNFAKWLSKMAHELNISIGLKNVAGIAPYLVDDFDFAVVESCSRSKNVCAKYENFPKKGKAVFTIHYGDFGSFNEQRSTMIQEMKGFGYTCVFNVDNNLKTPGYNFNCDTGSTTNLKGSIPKIDNNIKIGTPTFTTTTKKASTKKVSTKKTTSTKPVVKKTTTISKPVVKKTTTTTKPVVKKTTTTTKPVVKKTTTTTKPVVKKTTTTKSAAKNNKKKTVVKKVKKVVKKKVNKKN
jgi:endo-alpha-1,4-polygalactosaminidase (GH114 family)